MPEYAPAEPSLRALQLTQLEALREFDRICRKHGITYYLYGGTAIGAVRHNGFIPWDDDVDVMMLKSEFDRLEAVLPGELDQQRYFWQTRRTDRGYVRAFAKLRVNGTTYLERLGSENDMHHGVFIDVFILRSVADPGRRRARQKRLFGLATRLLIDLPPRRGIKRPVFIILRALLPKRLLCRVDNWNLCRYEGTGARDVFDGSEPAWFDRCCMDRQWFGEPVMMEFEGMQLPMPTGWHELLTQLYGDYMTPPLEEKRQYRHAVLVDLESERFGEGRMRKDCR